LVLFSLTLIKENEPGVWGRDPTNLIEFIEPIIFEITSVKANAELPSEPVKVSKTTRGGSDEII